MWEVAANAAVGVENHVVVVHTVIAIEEIVGHHAAGPASNIIGVGVTHVVNILTAGADDILEISTAPVDAVRGIVFLEIVINRITDGGVVVIAAATDEAFHIVAAIIAITEVFGTENRRGEFAKDRVQRVAESLVHDGLELLLIVERQTGNVEFRQQVVFADFAPTVVIVIVWVPSRQT